MNLQPNDHVSIVTAAGFNGVSGAMGMAAVHSVVTNATAKAVRVETETSKGKRIAAWFPKKALLPVGPDEPGAMPGSNSAHHTARVAGWFRVEGWTARWLEMGTSLSTLSPGR